MASVEEQEKRGTGISKSFLLLLGLLSGLVLAPLVVSMLSTSSWLGVREVKLSDVHGTMSGQELLECLPTDELITEQVIKQADPNDIGQWLQKYGGEFPNHPRIVQAAKILVDLEPEFINQLPERLRGQLNP